MDAFALIGLGLLTVGGLVFWPVMWTGRPPRFLRGEAAGHGWRKRFRSGLEVVPASPSDPAVILTVAGLFVGFGGLEIAESGGGPAGLGMIITAIGYSAAGIFGLLAVSVALFRRPRSLIPPYQRDPTDSDEG